MLLTSQFTVSINRRKKYVIVFDNLTCADIRTKELLTVSQSVSQLAAGCHGVRLWLIRKANTFSIYPTTPQKIISTFFLALISMNMVENDRGLESSVHIEKRGLFEFKQHE